MCPPPANFPKYLEEFCDEPSCIVAGPEMKTCCGIRNNSHLFLVAEGCHVDCKNCGRCVCKTCQFSFESNIYCDECFASVRLMSLKENINENEDAVVDFNISLDKNSVEMHKELKEAGWDVGSDATPLQSTRKIGRAGRL